MEQRAIAALEGERACRTAPRLPNALQSGDCAPLTSLRHAHSRTLARLWERSLSARSWSAAMEQRAIAALEGERACRTAPGLPNASQSGDCAPLTSLRHAHSRTLARLW